MRFIRSLFQPTLSDRKHKELLQAQVSLLHCQNQAEYYSAMAVYYKGVVRRLRSEESTDGTDDKAAIR